MAKAPRACHDELLPFLQPVTGSTARTTRFRLSFLPLDDDVPGAL